MGWFSHPNNISQNAICWWFLLNEHIRDRLSYLREDKQILRHACFCFRVSFFWLTVQIFTSALMVYQPAYLWLSSDCLLISLAYPHYKSQVTQMSSTAVKGSPVNPPQPRIKSQTTTPSEGDRPEQSGHCNSLNLSDKIRLMIVV